MEIVIPVYNEEHDLPACVRRLHEYLVTDVPYRSRIVIADNASTDATLAVAHRLSAELPDVEVIHLDAKGRGGAAAAWRSSPAEVVAYMDVDLSTDLAALMPLVAPLVSGHSDIAIGSRLAASSRVVRGIKREFVSRGYNLLLRGMLGARFSDAQCGFRRCVPTWPVNCCHWLLTLDGSSTPNCWSLPSGPGCASTRYLSTGSTTGLPRRHRRDASRISGAVCGCRALASAPAAADCRPPGPRAWFRVPRSLLRQLVRFALIGVASTIAYALLYLSLHRLSAPSRQPDRLLITALANTAANRAFTFRTGAAGEPRAITCTDLPVFAFGLAITSGSLFLLHRFDRRWTRLSTVGAWLRLVATVARFLALRQVFGAPPVTR